MEFITIQLSQSNKLQSNFCVIAERLYRSEFGLVAERIALALCELSPETGIDTGYVNRTIDIFDPSIKAAMIIESIAGE